MSLNINAIPDDVVAKWRAQGLLPPAIDKNPPDHDIQMAAAVLELTMKLYHIVSQLKHTVRHPAAQEARDTAAGLLRTMAVQLEDNHE